MADLRKIPKVRRQLGRIPLPTFTVFTYKKKTMLVWNIPLSKTNSSVIEKYNTNKMKEK